MPVPSFANASPITPLLPDETARLKALKRYNILDTPPELAFDRITSLAARLFDVPIALVSLIDASRGWFKSCYGFDLREVQRDATICSLVLLSDEVLVIPDTRQDDRLTCNPFVQSEPGLRFYAGAPLITQDGFNLGTLCLLDTKPRQPWTSEQQATLADLAAVVMDALELRLATHKISQIDTALVEVTKSVAVVVGDAFFEILVQRFTKVLGVDYAYIGLIQDNDPEVIRTIATCAKGEIIDNFDYSLRHTPCGMVIQERKLCCHPHSVQTLFPHAPLLAPLGVESYAAIPIFDSAGIPLGVLGIMHSKPLETVQLVESLLTIFALRVATELERQQTEAVRQQSQRNLEHQVIQRTAALSKTNQLLSLEVIDRQQAEAALQQEQEVLKVLLDKVQAGIVACNAEGILTLFNQAARDFHGLPKQSLPPEKWAEHYDLYLPDGKTRMDKRDIPLFRALQGEIVNQVEMVIAPKQGIARSLVASGKTLTDDQGNKQGAVVVMHDITERKQAEAVRLRLAEERTELIQQQVQEQTARLKAEAEQRRSAFLVEISTALSASLDYESTLTNVANLVVPYFADWCAIDLVQNQSIERVAVAHCDPEKVKLGWELHRKYPKQLTDAEGVSKVLRTGQAEIVAEIPEGAIAATAKSAEHLQILSELGLKSCIISPLIVRGQILGAISFVTAESDRRYSQADLALADDIVHRAAISIDNARLYRDAQQAQQAAERTTERIARLQSVTAAFSESVTPAQVAEVIVDQGIAALNANFAMVALLDEITSELEVVRVVGGGGALDEKWQRFSLQAPVPLAKAVRTGQPIWAEPSEVRAVHYPHLADMYAQQNFGAWISIPLMVEGRAFGGISLGFNKPQQLDEEQQTFILSLAQQCAQAIARAHLYESEQIARNDAVREAARSAKANRVKDEFLAVLSHELRTPLNPILGWAGLLRTGKLDTAKTAHALETIERNAKLQTQLIEDLLDVSRILQGKLQLNIAPVNLAFTIRSALETVQLAADAKGIELRTEIEEDSTTIKHASSIAAHPSRLMVLGDSVRLQQIIWNLLTNAIKFTDAGGQVKIRLSASDRHAQIQVIDTGKGIHPDFLPHVFEYFQQADSTTTRQFGGLGLGLAIVRHLVELHGGTVQADSLGEGKGATFTVQLTLLESQKLASEDDANNLSFSSSSFPPPLDGIRVLLVDDDADARDLVAFILEQAGAIVTVVDSAIAALKCFSQVKPDLLISDIGMPGKDGNGLIQEIRTLPPAEGGQVPAIALTAYAGEIDQQQAIAAGFERHMTKPVDAEALVQAIAQWVNPSTGQSGQ
ncbi:MAG: diguanylate cyclase [Leptolyngbya sp.]|nr:MAG: diguanylate cyclase [Leptolyngbya sp.]